MKQTLGPRLVSGSNQAWPLQTAAACRQAEQAALLQQAQPQALMARAGLAVARLTRALAPHARRIKVLAGPGNNGGDGLVAAVELLRAGADVQVLLLADRSRLPTDAAWALQQARAAGVPVVGAEAVAASMSGADLIVDALLGLGGSRAPEGDIAACIQALHDTQRPVLAIDLPTGLNGDTGQPLGHLAVRATATLCLLSLKPGCFTGRGRDLAGQVWLDDLGVEPAAVSAWLSGAPEAPRRLHDSHKGRFGDVAVVGGAPGMVGAAWLAARAASAAGAGRVFVNLLAEQVPSPNGVNDTPPQNPPCDPLRPELMLAPGWWQGAPQELARHTVVCGCGGGEAVARALPPLLAHAARLVLDADALNALASDSSLQEQLRRRSSRGLPTILTPHPLEAARLLQCSAAQVQADRLRAAQALAEQLACVVLLKGSGSIVAECGRTPHINPTGNAALATAGSGDVLAGWLVGRWAQHSASPAFELAADVAWLHGSAADRYLMRCQQIPTATGVLRASDLIEEMAGSPLRSA